MNIARQFLAGAVLVALSATVALAQVRQVQLGGGMDANPQVGTGGSNMPVPGYVPINGNDIMTGNVSGLAYFHGRAGSTSPYQFQGNLGSSNLSNFARQSAGGPYGMPQTYYLPSSVVSSSQGAMHSAPMGGGFDSSLIPRTSLSPVSSPYQINAATPSQVINLAVPSARIDAGRPGTVLSSPIFVLRTTELPTQRPDIGVPASAPAAMPAPGEDSAKPTPNPAMVEGAVNAGRDERIGGQSEEVKLALVSENYLKLAEELKANGAPVAGNPQPAAGGTSRPGMGTAGADIDPLTGMPRQMATLPPLPSAGGGRGAGIPSSRKAEPAPSAKALADMSDIELTAGGKVKPVKLAAAVGGGTGTMVSGYEMMLRAERNLKEAKFLDAAESYQAALSLKPADPLALVGRAHAEMGGGLYSAAAYDLKFVYTRKPELVAVKYDVDSFIPALRQEFLLGDLQKMTGQKETEDLASFLYCYLCYQTDRTTELKAELKRWGTRHPGEEWQAVLSRAWTPK